MLMKCLLALSLFRAANSWVFPQAPAAINGRILDQGGGALPGVTVTATNTGTRVPRTAVSNAEGLYSIPALERGIYDLQAELSGFATATRKGVELLTGSTLTADLSLGLAQLEESVTVQGQSPLVESSQSSLTSTIRQTEVAQLPMLNRSLAAMITLLPGAREGPTSGAHAHAASLVSFGGAAERNFAMLVDGAENKEDHDGGTTMVYSLERVQQFRA